MPFVRKGWGQGAGWPYVMSPELRNSHTPVQRENPPASRAERAPCAGGEAQWHLSMGLRPLPQQKERGTSGTARALGQRPGKLLDAAFLGSCGVRHMDERLRLDKPHPRSGSTANMGSGNRPSSWLVEFHLARSVLNGTFSLLLK